MTITQNALAKITRSVWELNELVKKDPSNYDLRRDLLLYFLDSKLYMETGALCWCRKGKPCHVSFCTVREVRLPK